MKTFLLSFVALSLLAAPAYANGDACERLTDDAWSCPIPTKPPGPPVCHIFGENLICTAPVVISPLPENKAPVNCGWNRKVGRYVCW